MKPLIGLMPLWDEEKKSLRMLTGYMDEITTAGGIPFMLPLTDSKEDIEQLAGICDGLLFTGGNCFSKCSAICFPSTSDITFFQ